MLAGWGAPIKCPIFGGYVFFRLTLVALQLSGYIVLTRQSSFKTYIMIIVVEMHSIFNIYRPSFFKLPVNTIHVLHTNRQWWVRLKGQCHASQPELFG